MKKFSIDSSNFESFIKDGYVYVDKTDTIYKLINNTIGSKFFLSRPRRFGKSLLLSTIKCIFEGRRNLFRRLKIDSLDWNWEETYPVLHLNMNECTGSIERVRKMVAEQLKELSTKLNIPLDETMSLSGQFKSLIVNLAATNKSNQIVLLLDEYDKPLLDHIGKEEVVPYQTFLKEFYTVIKDTEAYQRFTLITGVSKFAHVSIFSGLNNLLDLTYHPAAATLLGYTHEEMHENFKENIQALADANGVTYNKAFDKLIFHYDGYRFSSKPEKLFNPVSIANVLTALEYKNYWFATGTTTWLVSYLKTKPFFYNGKITISETKINSYDPKNPDIENLLLQTGYLTIIDVEEDFDGFTYTLDFPNNEVRLSFSDCLADAYITKDDMLYRDIRRKLVYSINDGNVEKMIDAMKQFYSTIPYDIQDRMKVEQAYQMAIAILLMYLGVHTHAEFRTNKGRIDILIQSPDFVYVIEMKLDKPAQEALMQIREKKYYEQFTSSNKKVYLIGLSFSSVKKNITEQLIEEV